MATYKDLDKVSMSGEGLLLQLRSHWQQMAVESGDQPRSSYNHAGTAA